MKTVLLAPAEVLAGYDAVSALYPYVPSLSHWRAWEHAAYRHVSLDGRVLDLGCGDGRYFQLLWPDVRGAVGVDRDPGVADAAVRSGVYRDVRVAPAHELPLADGSFDHVFANCSLEHMDHLDDVLAQVRRCLAPGGHLLCSVVTNRFLEWSVLPRLFDQAGRAADAAALEAQFVGFHHLVSALPPGEWIERLARAGLETELHIPILPRINSGAFLFMDGLWHVQRDPAGELGDVIYPFLSSNTRFPTAFRRMIEGLLEMETDPADCSGAVFLARRAP